MMFNLTEITNPFLKVKEIKNNIFGLEWDSKKNSFTRIENAAGKESKDFDTIAPWSNLRRCTLADDGSLIAYYGQNYFAEDGSNGQVMVEITKFYYRVEKEGDIKRWYICNEAEKGFKVHPAFIRNGEEIDKIYISAYEGCAYNKNTSSYLLENEQTIDFNNDLLSSIVGAIPADGTNQNFTIANARKLANNRGDGWGLQDIQTVSAIQILMIIEFGTFDIQKNISWGVSNNNPILKTGQTSLNGNNSTVENEQATDKNGDQRGKKSVSYRGIENFYGNVWTFIDGLNIKDDNTLYIADSMFKEGKYNGNYKKIGFKRPTGYADILDVGYDKKFDNLFIPFYLNSTNYVTAKTRVFYSYSITEFSKNAVSYFGGCTRFSAEQDGAFCYALQDELNHRDATVGARLVYFKNNGDNYPEGTIINYFEGSTNCEKTFKTSVSSININNDSEDILTFTINGITRTLYANESYQGTLMPFDTIEIVASGNYRVEVAK